MNILLAGDCMFGERIDTPVGLLIVATTDETKSRKAEDLVRRVPAKDAQQPEQVYR
jgi:hypothetical protein